MESKLIKIKRKYDLMNANKKADEVFVRIGKKLITVTGIFLDEDNVLEIVQNIVGEDNIYGWIADYVEEDKSRAKYYGYKPGYEQVLRWYAIKRPVVKENKWVANTYSIPELFYLIEDWDIEYEDENWKGEKIIQKFEHTGEGYYKYRRSKALKKIKKVRLVKPRIE